jgi:ketosteroid isomerase-like protein
MDKTLEQTDLPPAAQGFVDGWQGRDAERVAALFADDAVVSDEGRTHSGMGEIRRWIDETITLFTTTLTFLGAREVGDMVGASYRLTGDFPGGSVDLEYQFRLDEQGRIRRLDFDTAPV